MIPLYDTLGPENITYCLRHSAITTCFATGPSITQLAKTADIGNLKTIVVIGTDLNPADQTTLEGKGIHFVTWDALLSIGR